MNDTFVVLDFETANPKRVSACSVGGCVIKRGEIVDSFSTFIRPPCDFGNFAPMNVRIHGITPDKVADAPTFEDLFPKFKARVDGNVVVSYSKFDLSVINSLLEYYGHTSRFKHVDVCALAKNCISGLPNYKLPTVAKHLGLGEFNHHDADGVITADESNILIELLNIATHQFSGKEHAFCRMCGGPLLAEMKCACPWCLARESQDCELHDDDASHLDEIAESLSDCQKTQKQEC